MSKGTKWASTSLTLLFGLVLCLTSGNAFAQVTREITGIPGEAVNAITTWYYGDCSASLGVGSYTVDVAPKYGTLSYQEISAPIPGCPPGSPSVPAEQALYTLTAFPLGISTDYIQLTYSVNGLTAVDNITVVKASLAIASTLPNGTAGVTYPPVVLISGGDPPYTVTASGLPPGLVINSNGKVSGTPEITDSGKYQIMVTSVADTAGATAGPATISITIAPATNAACSISATTLAHVPNTDDFMRALSGRIGVGENVLLTAITPGATSPVSAVWNIAHGQGTLTPSSTVTTIADYPRSLGYPSTECSGASSSKISGSAACFIAPNNNDSTFITATLMSGESCSTTLTTIQPTGLIFQRMQFPNGSPDYLFNSDGTAGLGFTIAMQSAVFLTPGDVSFANIGISELDSTAKLSTAYHYNLLYDIKGTSAWLVGCDRNKKVAETLHAQHKQHDWVYVDRDGDETVFSKVKTAWSFTFLKNMLTGTAKFSKEQVEALSADGAFMTTPNALSSNLEVPAVDFNDLVISTDHSDCLIMINEQFATVPD